MVSALNKTEIAEALARHLDWVYDAERRAFQRHLELADFSAAFALMTRIALAAEKMDHHPEWANVYNRLDIWLTTHDAGGVSKRDLVMMDLIDGLVTDSR